MGGLLIASAILALLMVLVLWRALVLLRRRRLLAGGLLSLQAVLLLLAFFVLLLVFSNLQTYRRLSHEQPVADVYLRKLAPRRYQLSLVLPGEAEDAYFVLEGDQWQLDARVLKWKPWANLLGLDTFYRLDRLSSRHADIDRARRQLPSVHDLSPPQRGLDIWRLQHLLRGRLRFVDTLFGQSVFMPMADGAHYRVTMGQGGLLVRPQNEIARKAVEDGLR
jgi:hypothetical protein